MANSYFFDCIVPGEILDDKDKNLGLTWIADKNNLYVHLCGELKKKQSDYFFDAYLDPEIQSSMNPLDWWRQSITSACPQGILEIINTLFLLPAGSSGIERSFSTMGNIMTKQRNRLSVEKATKLCCINGYFKISNEQDKRKRNDQRIHRKRKFPEEQEEM